MRRARSGLLYYPGHAFETRSYITNGFGICTGRRGVQLLGLILLDIDWIGIWNSTGVRIASRILLLLPISPRRSVCNKQKDRLGRA